MYAQSTNGKLGFTFGLLVLLLAACSQAPGAVTAPASTPGGSSSPTPASPALVSPTVPPGEPPTAAVSGTPTSIQTSAPGTSATPDSPPEATPDPALVGTVSAASQPQVIETALPPDGSLLAQVIRYECTPVGDADQFAYEQLLVGENSPAADAVVVDEQLQTCGGLGAFGLGNLFWTTSGRYLYYTDAREGQPDGLVCHLDRPLHRYDFESGEKLSFLRSVRSPAGDTLAIREGGDLILWDLELGEIGRMPATIPGAFLAQAGWDESGSWLLLLYNDNPDCTQAGKSYLVRADLPALTAEVLHEKDAPPFTFFTWEETGTVLLVDLEGGRWRFDPGTGSLSPAE